VGNIAAAGRDYRIAVHSPTYSYTKWREGGYTQLGNLVCDDEDTPLQYFGPVNQIIMPFYTLNSFSKTTDPTVYRQKRLKVGCVLNNGILYWGRFGMTVRFVNINAKV
jgi:hypothetical protein